MDILINVGLPLSLAFIMLSLGIGLTFADFARVISRAQAFGIGAVAQVIVLPLTAFGVVSVFGISGALAVGIMLLSFCPGGVTSNMITRISRGDVALSVSLTAVISLLSILTLPFLATWAVAYFMGDDAPDVSVGALAFSMFLITTLPVLIGLMWRQLAPSSALRCEPIFTRIATVLFVLIVIAALAGNWAIFVANLPSLGPALIALNITLLLFGLGLAVLTGLNWAERKTVSIETGVQNATLGIAMAAIITGQTSGFSEMALPSAVYGILMYGVTLPFVLWLRRK